MLEGFDPELVRKPRKLGVAFIAERDGLGLDNGEVKDFEVEFWW